MKRCVLFVVIALSLPVAAQGSPPTPPPGYRWEAIPELSDEFDGDTLDSSKWLDHFPGWIGWPPSYFDRRNVSVKDGLLRIRATLGHPEAPHDRTHLWIATGCVASIHPASYYGYYEVRMKGALLPSLSAFWLQSRSNPGSEIDVQEGLGAPLKGVLGSVMSSSVHYYPNDPRHRQVTRVDLVMSRPVASWHTYGVWWKDNRSAWFYLDDNEVAMENPAGASNRSMYLYIDAEQHSARLPDLDELQNPDGDVMLVDWVRSWRLVPVNAPDLGRDPPAPRRGGKRS